MTRSGADLALLLLSAYRLLVDDAVEGLAAQGHPDVRPVHDFAMRAILSGADSASELGRRMAVSKQAAAKTIATLVERGYVVREPDPRDARRKRIEVTPLGLEVMSTGEAIFDELRQAWATKIGSDQLAEVEERLATLVGDARIRVDAPGWVADEAAD